MTDGISHDQSLQAHMLNLEMDAIRGLIVMRDMIQPVQEEPMEYPSDLTLHDLAAGLEQADSPTSRAMEQTMKRRQRVISMPPGQVAPTEIWMARSQFMTFPMQQNAQNLFDQQAALSNQGLQLTSLTNTNFTGGPHDNE